MNLRDLLRRASSDVQRLNAELMDDRGADQPRPPVSEDDEQIRLFRMVEALIPRYPDLRLLFHVPNGGLRSKATARRMKAMGVKAGVPDLCLPVARGGYHGLAIEMKVGRNKPTAAQRWWITELGRQGYKVAVCYGAEEAMALLVGYLGEPSE